ncbi:C40 family peptidase [Flavobacterium agrisoli]|uniref:C40 family peptidase n=1 Tax=Flavobacterium agrisoli TaxID=2793066 RepID=A0A934UKF0_9FLAO|nr:C40 family peptidase [Flavobacterium agrisoli]MBK0370488.1 C40 family peptidase [Flavobacterium agrisoli]
MKSSCLITMLFMFSFNAFSQQKSIEHVVVKGDNIYQISKKYKVSQEAIFAANPQANGVLKLNAVLQIPDDGSLEKKEEPITKKFISHKVSQKETLYGISKQYQVGVAEIESSNPDIKTTGLRAEQIIQIPMNDKNKTMLPTENEKHIVVAQTKPKIETKLSPQAKTKLEVEVKPEIIPFESVEKNTYSKEVMQKETKYGIAKEFGITVEELEKQNPIAKNGLKVGQKLSISTSKTIENGVLVSELALNEERSKTDEKAICKNELSENNPVFSVEFADQLISHASENIGVRYRTGGTSKEGFDCSGLMVATFGNFDIHLPRTSFEQSQMGTVVNMEEAQKGDLIFFKTNGRKQINHVGMVVENNEGEIKFIHAAVHGGVMISSTKESYYDQKLAQINRVLK